MADQKMEELRGTGNRIVAPEPVRKPLRPPERKAPSIDDFDDPIQNFGPADPHVIRKPLRHRDKPPVEGHLQGEPKLDLGLPPRRTAPADDDHKLLNRAAGPANRFPSLGKEPRRMGDPVPDLRPAKTDPKLRDLAPYEGEVLTHTPGDLDFSTVYAVVVSGDFPNPCGHALLFVPKARATASNVGSYFQVAGAYTFPRIMDNAGYARYLRTNGKTEITRYELSLPNPDGAINRLTSLMLKKWVWAILPHNCAAFVEDIVQAGGSTAGLYSNCPRAERFK